MIKLLIKNSPITYATFRAWITIYFKGDIIRVQKFESMADMYIIPVLIKYLEDEKKVPILNAMNYYSKLRYIQGYNNQAKNMILYEFSRIEQGKTTNYNIF